MNSVHEGRIISHFFGHWPEQVADALLMLNINLEIADQNNTAIRPDAFLAATEFA